MRPLKHVFRNAFRFFNFILIYLLSILFILVVFSSVYSHYSIINPFRFSVDIIWGSPTVPEEVHSTVILQKIIYDVFLVFLLGSFVLQRLKPINPVEYSKYVAYDDRENRYFFRYWVLLPKNKYLFNATVRLVVTTREEINSGINSLSTTFNKQDSYNSIRGVRFFKIEGSDADRFAKAIKERDNSIISLYITGTNESGITYPSVERYTADDIKTGYGFVSIRKSEYKKQADGSTDSITKEVLRYQHFDKIYKLEGDAGSEKDELSKGKILNGQYAGPRQWILDFFSWIESLFLES